MASGQPQDQVLSTENLLFPASWAQNGIRGWSVERTSQTSTRRRKAPASLTFVASVFWRAVSPGVCPVVILTQSRRGREAPASLDPTAGSPTPPGKLPQLPHDPSCFLPSISLGWMVGYVGFPGLGFLRQGPSREGALEPPPPPALLG